MGLKWEEYVLISVWRIMFLFQSNSSPDEPTKSSTPDMSALPEQTVSVKLLLWLMK